MGAMVGFLVGYVMGARSGEQGYEELATACRDIAESDEFRALVAAAQMFAQNALAQGAESAAGNLRDLSEGRGPLGQALKQMAEEGNLGQAWAQLAESGEPARFVSGLTQAFAAALARVLGAAAPAETAKRPGAE